MGIRARLTIGMVLLLLAGFGVLGVVVVRSTQASLVEQIDARIRAATLRLDAWGGPPGRGGDQDGDRDGDEPGGQDANHAGDRGDDNRLGGGPDGDGDADRLVTPTLPERPRPGR